MLNGTIIGFSGRDIISDFINVMSCGIPRWSVSHVGITVDDLLVEARSTHGVTATLITQRLEESPGRIYEYQPVRPLYYDESARLNSYLASQLGKPYDLAGALRSGGFVFAALQKCLHREDLQKLFCSELVASAIQQVGTFQTNHASWLSPNKLCRLATRRGVYRDARRLK